MTLNSGHENMQACSTSKEACSTSKEKSKVVVRNQSTQNFIDIMSPKVNKVPLKEKDHTSWLEFKKLDEGRPALTSYECAGLEGKWPIDADHPFVTVIRDFATDTFNVLAHMRSKNSLCHPEVLSCKYMNAYGFYYFYLRMEGIEAGILGVYEVIVACDLIDGSTSLVRLRLLNLKPSGKIATMLPHLISLRSKHKTMKGMERDLKAKLKKTRKSIKGKKNKRKVAAKLIQLEEEHKAIKDKRIMLYQHIQSQIPKTWFPLGIEANWIGCNRSVTGLENRSISRGRDYCTHSLVGRMPNVLEVGLRLPNGWKPKCLRKQFKHFSHSKMSKKIRCCTDVPSTPSTRSRNATVTPLDTFSLSLLSPSLLGLEIHASSDLRLCGWAALAFVLGYLSCLLSARR
ncbi:hypothetical protein CTI12_AA491250 [Artemisia annua]|uniref:Uncharacterized protein n=1 Tax=Artemisia annua TaxID=35608 RepID=A0A2U1LHF2_ARTAN|nr:hypothetical protein CTI12_AA491250 [Artemisia annua]